LRDEMSLMKEEEVKLRTKLGQAKVDAYKVLPASIGVNRAQPADKKSYPVRWLICALAGIGAFVMTLFSILVLNTWKELRGQLKA